MACELYPCFNADHASEGRMFAFTICLVTANMEMLAASTLTTNDIYPPTAGGLSRTLWARLEF